MKTQIGDVKEWLTTNEDRVYGFLIYRRMFTPYEQDQKFEDETQFEDIHFTYGRIKEAVSLGGSDWLFGFQLLDEGDRDASGNDDEDEDE